MLFAGPLAMLAWLLVRGESAKLWTMASGMALLVATATLAMRQLVFVGRQRALAIAGCLGALAACLAQRGLFAADFAPAQAEIRRLGCADVAAIEAGGNPAGREWTRLQGMYRAHAPSPWRWIDLYVYPFGDGRYFISAGAWMSDDVHGELDCRGSRGGSGSR